jgi:mannosyl-3-phosphoglycerate synthase
MLLRLPARFEVFGAVRFYDVSEVVSLNSMGFRGVGGVFGLDRDSLVDMASKTAIVVPVKDEDPWVFEGVIKAVPLASPLIVVSASSREGVDIYSHEVEVVKLMNRLSGRRAVVVHQRDSVWVEVLSDTELRGMLDGSGVRYGKGEGMILGVLVASWLGARYVGFIDSDNYVPGAVSEYAMAYYTGLAMLESRYSMVRIVWPHKGKLPTGDIIFRKRGRVSMHTNAILNNALSNIKKVETDVVKTANSGEHAMSLDLALKIPWAGRFAVETEELVAILEQCYVNVEFKGETCPLAPEGVRILQVETRSPHIHAEKGDEHLARMAAESLGAIYHSSLADNDLKVKIKVTLIENYHYEEEPPQPRIYTLNHVDPSKVISEYLSLSEIAVDTGY